MADYKINITVTDAEGKVSTVAKTKKYNQVTYINKEFDNNDAFDTLVEFDWDGINENFNDCKGVLIENAGQTAAELQFVMEEWTAGVCDANAADSYNNTYLGAGDCLYLPHNRMIGYSAASSAGGGTTSQFDNTQAITNSYLTSATLVNMGGGTTVGDTSGLDAITVDGTSAYQFVPGDILLIGLLENAVKTEAVKVVSIDSATQITVERGVLGTTPVTHADDQPFYWYWGNTHLGISQIMGTSLAFVAAGAGTAETITDSGNGFLTAGMRAGDIILIDTNGGANDATYKQIASVVAGTASLHENCSLTGLSAGTSFKLTTVPVITDSQGRYHTSNWFGKFRYAAATDLYQGIVPGSVMIQFCNSAEAFIPVGNSVTLGSDSGLTAGTTYRWNIILDGYEANLTSIVNSGNTNFGGVNGVIAVLQKTIDDAVKAETFPIGAVVGLRDGHIVIKSKNHTGSYGGHLTDTENTNYSRGSSQVIIQDSTTGSETQLLGAGRMGSNFIEVFPRFPSQVKYDNDGKQYPDTANMMIDTGNGTLKGQGASGTINYNTGELSIIGAPSLAQMRVSATGCSALAGGVMRTHADSSNCIEKISARSMNPNSRVRIKCTLFS